MISAASVVTGDKNIHVDPDGLLRFARPDGTANLVPGSTQLSAFASHTHATIATTAFLSDNGPDNPVYAQSGGLTGASGSSSETRSTNIYVNKIIKY